MNYALEAQNHPPYDLLRPGDVVARARGEADVFALEAVAAKAAER